MSDMVIFGRIDEEGHLIVELPADAPQGEVEIIIRKRTPELESLAQEDDVDIEAELEKLLTPEHLNGQSLPMSDVLQSGAIGIWKDREDTKDPAAWISEMRQKSRERHLKRG